MPWWVGVAWIKTNRRTELAVVFFPSHPGIGAQLISHVRAVQVLHVPDSSSSRDPYLITETRLTTLLSCCPAFHWNVGVNASRRAMLLTVRCDLAVYVQCSGVCPFAPSIKHASAGNVGRAGDKNVKILLEPLQNILEQCKKSWEVFVESIYPPAAHIFVLEIFGTPICLMWGRIEIHFPDPFLTLAKSTSQLT